MLHFLWIAVTFTDFQSSGIIPVSTELVDVCEGSSKFILWCTDNPRVKHIWSCGLIYVQMLQLLLYFFSTEFKSIKGITFILALLFDVIQLFNGEHRAKVIIHCVGHVIVGCANNSFQSFEWPYVSLTILLSFI